MLQIDNVAEYIFSILEELDKKEDFSHKNIIIYEFSAQAKVAVAYLKKKGALSVSIVDHNTLNWGKNYNGITISVPKEELGKASDETIVIVFDHGHEKKEEVLKINSSLENRIYEIDRFNYADFPCRLKKPKMAEAIELHQVHAELLELMKYFHEFCRKHKLQYFLDGGSLLGAVRHKGFIPWDDDLDVTMPMPDYLKLCKLLSEDCDRKYEFWCLHEDKQETLSVSSISRLLLRNVVTDCSHYPIHKMEGMGLDIWALAGFPDDVQEQQYYSLELEYMGDYWKENVIIPYGRTSNFREMYESAQARLLKKMTAYDYDKCNYVGYAYCGKILHVLDKKNRAFPKRIFSEAVLLEFEGEKFYCPKEYDSYLTGCFGDYMQLPPLEERRSVNSGVIYKLSDISREAGMRLKGKIEEISYKETKTFFKNRAYKYNPENPYSVTMYQDNQKELVIERNQKEVEILYPKLDINKESRILDVACGIGRWADAIRDEVKEYWGIDFSNELIDIANSRNERENFHFMACDLQNMEVALKGKKYNTVLLIGILVYLNDADLKNILTGIERMCDEHTIICIREPISSDERLTLKKFYSEELHDDYNAIYRTRNELVSIFEETFLEKGFKISDERALFEEKELNNRKETYQYYLILKR